MSRAGDSPEIRVGSGFVRHESLGRFKADVRVLASNVQPDHQFSEAVVYSISARARCAGQAMMDYVTRWKQMTAQLTSMDTPFDEALLLTMFVERLPDLTKSALRTTSPSPLAEKVLMWQAFTSLLLQELTFETGFNADERSEPGRDACP